MEENKKSYYAIIPANVRYDESLMQGAKLLYGEITALCSEKGYCWASNSYFAELYKVSERTIKSWLSSLSVNGYVRFEYEYREHTKCVKHRYIFINSDMAQKVGKIISKGGEENFPTWGRNLPEGGEENFPDNNTYNNTFNNTNNNIGGIGHLSDKRPPEIELEIEIEKEKDIEIDIEKEIDREKRKRFIPPSVDEVRDYAFEANLSNINPEVFVDYYTSNGWMAGKNKMKDWKAAARNWDRRSYPTKSKPATNTIDEWMNA